MRRGNHGRALKSVHTLTGSVLAAVALLLAGCRSAAAPPPRLTVDRELAALREAVRWPAPDNAVVMSLATQFIAARQDAEARRYFAELAAAVPDRPVFLALEGMFQARMAAQVPLLRRVAWVEEAIAKQDRAVTRDASLSRIVRGLTLARLPPRFHKMDAAVADLRWVLEAADSPLARQAVPPTIADGLRRGAWQALAYAHGSAGRARESEEALRRSGAAGLGEDAPLLDTAYSVRAREGFRFGAPRILSEGNVHVAVGYDFANISFVVTSAGVVAIDAGTTPESARAALEAFRREVSDAPLRAVIVTHAHWDHVGGLAAIATPGTEIIAQGRYREELSRVGQAGNSWRWFFGENFRNDATFAFTPTRTVSARTTIRFGDTEFDLAPVRGGETDDALLIRLPASGIVFVGDVFMPYLGAPFVAEGSPTELIQTIETLKAMAPRRLVHGHPPLDDYYRAAVLEPLGAALRDLEATTSEAIRRGTPLASILEANVLPEVLRSHPDTVMPFVLMRDQFITRLQRQRTGYWQPDGEGIERFTAAEWGRALHLLAGGDESAFVRAGESLVARGDHAMALQLVTAGLVSFPESGPLRAVRTRALEGLREKNQQLNPFKFIVYSEMEGAELPPLASP